MREPRLAEAPTTPCTTLAACLAAVLDLPLSDVPQFRADQDPATGWQVARWLGGLGLGLVRVADTHSFAWAGPWIGRVAAPGAADRLAVVMFGVPSGVLWDPSGVTGTGGWQLVDGFVVAALDIAGARPPRVEAPSGTGTVEGIWVAADAGAPAISRLEIEATPAGLAGDRHVRGTGTFPSGLPGSALTLIQAEVCDGFDPPLAPHEHRRNVVTRRIELNGLVGRDFEIGTVRCRGMRLCEPCLVVERYAGPSVLRALVHRGGLRADILAGGTFRVGDAVRVA